jgi:hypothetical protein
MMEEVTTAKRKRKKGKGKASSRPEPTRVSGGATWTVALTLFTLFILLIGSSGVALERAAFMVKGPEDEMTTRQAITTVERELEAEVYIIAAGILADMDEPNLVQANILFKKAFEELVEYNYDPRRIGDHRVTVVTPSSGLDIQIMPMSVRASACTGDIDVSGTPTRFTAPAYYRVNGALSLSVEEPNGATTEPTTHIDLLVPNLSPYVSTRLDELQANAKSEFTDIGRMVRYMLTTLVRYRTTHGIGSGPYDTEKDLLNEGDVELAVNLAVLLEEARLFGTYDKDAADAVDHYFYNATDPAAHLDEVEWQPYKPTGLRQWGTGEIKNYARYLNHRDIYGARTIAYIIGNAITAEYIKTGTIDPANLLAYYLNLDMYESGLSADYWHARPLLQQKELYERRRPDDRDDSSHLEYRMDISPPELLFNDPTETFMRDYKERLSVDHYPDYLLVGRDIRVGPEITEPWKWTTNVRLGEGSRTGGVPPPQAPPEHEWVMLWEFDITGQFDLSVGKDLTHRQEDGTKGSWAVNRTIELDIPINIFAYLNQPPKNGAVFFTNINVGSPFGATFNFTYESKAYEHFANETWFFTKGIIGEALGDAIRLVKGSACPYHCAMAQGSNMTVLRSSEGLSGISDDVWLALDDFVTTRLLEPKLSTMILRPFLNSEYFVDIDYFDVTDIPNIDYRIRMVVGTNVGDMTMDLYVSEGGAPGEPLGFVEVSSSVAVEGLLDVVLSLDEDGLTGSGKIGGDWKLSIPTKKTGRAFVDVKIDDGLTVRLLTDLKQEITNLVLGTGQAPLTLGEFMEALGPVVGSEDGLTILFAYEAASTEWYGLEAPQEDIHLVLDWIERNADAITALSYLDRLELSTLGMAAADHYEDLAGSHVVSYTDEAHFRIPVMYFSVLVYQLDLEIGSLEMDALSDLSVTSDQVTGKDAWTGTMSYTARSEIMLKNLEDPYG